MLSVSETTYQTVLVCAVLRTRLAGKLNKFSQIIDSQFVVNSFPVQLSLPAGRLARIYILDVF
jgi:hypothetical protein